MYLLLQLSLYLPALPTALLQDPICLLDLLHWSLGVDTDFVFPELGHQALWQKVVEVKSREAPEQPQFGLICLVGCRVAPPLSTRWRGWT